MHMQYTTCGSEPARESAVSVNVSTTDRTHSRAGSLPQGFGGEGGFYAIKKGPHPAKETAPEKRKSCYRAVITDNLVIPARSIEAMARATSP
ncbi:hypothetical protein F7R05_21095 [Pseudomonas koreensis]|nr:hypothetical protein F7R05_21095 [Pseudomonas koreensis]GGK23819.1 hypothetical protein GCM10009103_18820 [Pseudomonas koreensis]